MSEFTNTYNNRNNNVDGHSKTKNERSRKSTHEFPQSEHNDNEQTFQPEYTEFGGFSGYDEKYENGKEESENDVLSYHQNNKIKKQHLSDPILIRDKLNKFKQLKKLKYKDRIQKEKEKHFKWKNKCRTFKQNYNLMRSQPEEKVVHMMDSFGRIIKN